MTGPDLNFTIEGAEPVRYAASPQINFKLRVSNESGTRVHSAFVKCQVDLDVSRRPYTTREQQRLTDLGESLRRMLWTNTSVIVPSFDDVTLVDLPVPCTFDFNIAATKYFAAIEDGDVPISFYFSGTVFYR